MSGGAHRARVLVAEDSDLTAAATTAALDQAGYEVSRARDGAQCLALARAESPDVLLLDLMMPKVHGLDVLESLKADPETAGIGVIVCSAKNFKTEVDQAMDLGAFAFLSKPVSRQQLTARIEEFLQLRGRRTTSEAAAGAGAAQQLVYEPEIPATTVTARLWGTRGSIPVSGPAYVRHGGNTTCMEVRCGDESVLFDAGSGIRDAGAWLLEGGPRRVHLFITHTHWDHIQGFPFFPPAYVPGFEIVIHAAHNVDKDMEAIFRGQLDRAYFPVQLEDMQADLRFEDLPEGPVRIGDMEIRWEYALHPGSTVGYRVDVDGRAIVFFPDNEALKGYLGDPRFVPRSDVRAAAHEDQLRLMEGADLIIHEAQYTQQEYPRKVAWGHSSVANACALVAFSGVPRWIATHHDPGHDDDTLQAKLAATRRVLADLGCEAVVDHAYDGMAEYL